MANREQLRRLRNGVEEWNYWRSENPQTLINLRGANLKGSQLRSINFSGADVRGTNFSEANLSGASFHRAEAGLQNHWAASLILLMWIGGGLSGGFTGVSGQLVSSIVNSDRILDVVAGWSSILALIIFYILLFHKGISTEFTIISSATLVGIFAVLVIGSEAADVALNVALVLAGAIAATFILVITVGVTGILANTITVVGAISFAIAISILTTTIASNTSTGKFVSSGVAIVLIFLSSYMAKRSLFGDEKYAVLRSISVAMATMGGTSFQGSTLTGANFSEAQLKSTDLRNAIITRTNWHISKLDLARCGGTILDNSVIRELAVTHRGAGQSYIGQNLKGIDLRRADLSDADFTEADLSDATLEGAILERANLTKVQSIRTYFRQANLTAACLESWNIDGTTQLDDVVCEYVYLLNDQEERRPSIGSFTPGEFTRLFEKALNTVDLIFSDGIDWQVFFASFQELRQQYEDVEVNIQAIEKKSGGTFVVRLELAQFVDKGTIQLNWKEIYEENQQLKAQILKMEGKLEQADTFFQKMLQGMDGKSVSNITNNLQGAIIGSLANQLNDNASQNYSNSE
jgi:uncharacterized protein YjbI with pentapeptide repeats